MPIRKKQGEKKNDFINRCIGVEVGSGMKPNQATAVCNSYWEEMSLKELNKKRKLKTKLETLMYDTFSGESGENFTKFGLTLTDLMNPKNQNSLVLEGELLLDFASSVPEGYEVRYKYLSNEYGPKGYSNKSRPFCKMMMTQNLNIWWSREDIDGLNDASGKADRAGGKPYSVFNWRGGNNCKHIWVRYLYNPITGDFLNSPVQPLQKSTEPR